MEEEKVKSIEPLDIHEVSTRLFRLYLECIHDSKEKFKYQVTSIQKQLDHPDDKQFMENLKCKVLQVFLFNEITIDNGENLINPIFDDLFHPSVQFENEKDREDWFWRISLSGSCTTLTAVLMNLKTYLSRVYNHDHFRGFICVNGKIEERKLSFDEMEFRILGIVEQERDLLNESVLEQKAPYDAPHSIVALKNQNLVFDPTFIQFGVRGENGEIVGFLQDFEHYKSKFPGIVVRHDTSYTYNDIYDRGLSIFGDPTGIVEYTKKILRLFKQDLGNDVKWCGYCGKSLEKDIRCGKCLKKFYCERKCQISHWKSHKRICKKS